MTSTLPMTTSSYTSPPLVNAMSTIHPLPSPPANDAELPKPHGDAAGSVLASRRQNVSLPAFTFPSPTQRSFGYGLQSPAPSLLTPPSGNDHIGPVDGNNTVNQSFWANTTPSHATTNFPYGSGSSSQSTYATAPSPAYAHRGIVSPMSSSSRGQPLSPHHHDTVPSSASQHAGFDGHSYSSGLAVPAPQSHSYSSGYSYSTQAPLTPVPQNAITSPHDAYSSPPSSLPPPTPSSGYYAQHSPTYPYHGHPISVGPASPSVARPTASNPLSHLHHPLHASTPMAHNSYQSAHPRYLAAGMATNMYAQHGASIMSGLTPHLAGSTLQHSHMHPSQHAPVPHQERPFRCDQCPQSFNRNHDLKRHKRIHLAVKPFPCPNCDKSFSRKDALKRHVLVKGCGNASTSSKPANP